MESKAKTGIALSGGGVRGVAHLGVLKALNEAGIFPDRITGTSAGAIVGAFYCSGYEPDEILEIIIKTKFFKFLRPAISKKGLLKMDVLESLYGHFLAQNDFSNLKIPLSIAAVDISKSKVEYFSEGEIIKPLMASTCIPGIFDPVYIGNDAFVDGGILNNMPIDPLEGKCEFIIGVNCNHLPESHHIGNMTRVIERAVIMAMSCNVYSRQKRCDFFIEPQYLGRFGAFDIKHAKEIFQEGYRGTIASLEADSNWAALGKLEKGKGK